jgi:CheY-like chemotaxis protein
LKLAALAVFSAKFQITLHFPGRLPMGLSVNAISHFSSRKILVVDDNPVLLRALSMALSARGYEVFTAVDASEAFGFARMEKLDLILLDIFFPPDIMQSGMTWDAFRIIEWMHRVGVAEGVPVMVISGAEPAEFEDRCLDAGAVAFFHKPINMPELLGTIYQLFNPDGEAGKLESDLVLPPQITPPAPLSPKYF